MRIDHDYGVPTVALHTSVFQWVVRSVARANGMPHMRQVFVPQPVIGKSPGELRAYIEGNDPVTGRPVMREVIEGLTAPFGEGELNETEFERSTPRLAGPAGEEELHRLFQENGWTDYLPIILPTEERVKAMLAGTGRKADEVVGHMRPTDFREYWEYTVEKVAVNAVMAGAKPEYFPVILAMAASGVSARGSSTSSMASMAVVNGPVRNEIGMNCGTGALAPYNHANATIGRAYGLLSQNLQGGSVPGHTYMGSQGNGLAYGSMSFGENEERSPWEPFHVQHGFKPGESAVSLFTGWIGSAHAADAAARPAGGADVHRPRRLRHQGEAHRLDRRERAHAGGRVLGLPARAELYLPARDLRRRAVGREAQGGAGRADPDVSAQGHSRRGGRRRDQPLLAHHGLHLPEDRLRRRMEVAGHRAGLPGDFLKSALWPGADRRILA
ncbi:MAG: hypothetical protein HYY83_00755 [Deltaproteobacteria bacterium]|nr:hypothetical protein [Deltaproteobacteria bacterium]